MFCVNFKMDQFNEFLIDPEIAEEAACKLIDKLDENNKTTCRVTFYNVKSMTTEFARSFYDTLLKEYDAGELTIFYEDKTPSISTALKAIRNKNNRPYTPRNKMKEKESS